jgi:hypothetical protein
MCGNPCGARVSHVLKRVPLHPETALRNPRLPPKTRTGPGFGVLHAHPRSVRTTSSSFASSRPARVGLSGSRPTGLWRAPTRPPEPPHGILNPPDYPSRAAPAAKTRPFRRLARRSSGNSGCFQGTLRALPSSAARGAAGAVRGPSLGAERRVPVDRPAPRARAAGCAAPRADPLRGPARDGATVPGGRRAEALTASGNGERASAARSRRAAWRSRSGAPPRGDSACSPWSRRRSPARPGSRRGS